MHESHQRRRIVPVADTTGRKLGRISPPREISNFGASQEIIQTHLRFRAMLTCRFARRPPCRSHVPGGALIEYPPPPHTELLAFDGTEGAKLVLSEETSQNFVRGKCVPVWCYSPRSKSRTSQGTTPLLQLAAHCGGGVVSRCLLIWITWHHLAAIDLRECAKLIMSVDVFESGLGGWNMSGLE